MLPLLTLTAADLQHLLTTTTLTSQDLILQYLSQIASQNLIGASLHAIISTAPLDQVLARAKLLDEERARSGSRGPLHGIPIVVKDKLCTPSLGMDTTCGSYLLKGQRAVRDAVAIQKLQDAGAIILAKANLTELGHKKGVSLTSGGSAVGGQTQSPYVRGGVRSDAMPLGHSTPAGSSSGSAVAVAAGCCPIAIGTESDGSPGGEPYDTIGVLAKGCEDIGSVLNVLMDQKLHLSTGRSWTGISIGLVDLKEWWLPEPYLESKPESYQEQVLAAVEQAMEDIQNRGGRVFRSTPLITMPEFERNIPDAKGLHDVMNHPFRKSFEEFLSLFPNCPAKTLKDVIDFNKNHADFELPSEAPDQDLLPMAEEHSMRPEVFEQAERLMRDRTTSSLTECMKEKRLDVIMACGDGLLPPFSAASGCLIGAVPLGFAEFNNRAFGMHMIAEADQEEKLLNIMRLWEDTFPNARKPPDLAS
ncbi:MAG: hypothetical protein Q9222_006429 [Ikaeria aurantiellina]